MGVGVVGAGFVGAGVSPQWMGRNIRPQDLTFRGVELHGFGVTGQRLD